jgi:hypothetical protein
MSFVFIGILIGALTPSGYDASPSVMYQQGMLHIFSGVLTLIGGVLLILTSVLSLQKKKTHCSRCGAKVLAQQDKFCRICGALLE